MKIYKINSQNGYFDGVKIVPDSTKGIDPYFTRTAPPEEIPENMYVIWRGNRWALTPNPPYRPEVTELLVDSDQDSDNSSIQDSSL